MRRRRRARGGMAVDVVAVGMLDPAQVPGGLDRYRVDLDRALTERGHRVAEVCAALLPAGPGQYPAGGPWATVWGARRAVRRILGAGGRRWTLVAAHFALPAAGVLSLAPAAHLPWVVHFHGPWAEEARVESGRAGAPGPLGLRGGLERLVYRRARAVITLSSAFGRMASERYGVPPQRVAVIPPGVDLHRFRPGDRDAARRRWGLDPAARVLLTVRRLARRMGLEVLLDAVRRLPPENWVVLVAGDGELRAELAARVQSLGLEARVRLLGRVPDADLPDLYRAADVFVLPSLCLEGFGMVIPEALASGVPVLAFDVGGIPEALEGLPGCLVPPRDVERLAWALTQVVTGGGDLPTGAAVRRLAERRFSWDAVASRVEAVYREAARV